MFELDMYITIKMYRNEHEIAFNKIRVRGGTSTRQGAITMVAQNILDYIQYNADLVEVATEMYMGNDSCGKKHKVTITETSDVVSSFRGLAVDIAQTIGGELHPTPINQGGM